MSTDRDYQKHEAMLLNSMPLELRDKLQHSPLLNACFSKAIVNFETYEQFIHGLAILLLRQNDGLTKQLIEG